MINLKNIIFGIAIFVLTLFVGIYGISTLYGASPQYDHYCPNNLINKTICAENGGTWVDNSQAVADVSGGIKTVPVGGGYCQYDYTPCQEKFNNAEEKYFRKVFITAIPLGVLMIFFGFAIFSLESVGAGLMFGGVGTLIYGTGIYWRFTDDWLKFVLSLAGLIILIGFAYWFSKQKKSFWKRFFRR